MITNKTAREFVIAKKLFPDISTSVIETDTATGTIANFETNMTEPIVNGVFEFKPVQEGTGDPSPSNPRAIHGYTSMNIVRCGKNLLNLEDGTKTVGAVTMTIASGKCTFSGNTESMSDFAVLNNLTLVDGVTYTLSGTPLGGGVNRYRMWVRRSDSVYYNDDGAGVSFTYDKSYTYSITIRLWNGYGEDLEFKPQIEVGSTATTYEPYTATTYPISWQNEAGTVYGGELNATTGLLRVTHGYADLGSLNWDLRDSSGGINRFRSEIVADLPSEAVRTLKLYCNKLYNAISPDGAYINNSIYNYNLDNRFFVSTSEVSTGTDLKTWLNGFYCVYPLATPLEVQLTPQEVRTLLGTNNIYHDCNGDSTITYKKSVPGQTTTDKRQFLPLIYGKKYYRKEY